MNKQKQPQKPNLGALQDLYPVPKTYDEKVAERTEIRKIRLSHQPKNPRLVANLIATGLIAATAVGIVHAVSSLKGMGGASEGAVISSVSLYGLYAVGLFVAYAKGIPKIRELYDLDTRDQPTKTLPPDLR